MPDRVIDLIGARPRSRFRMPKFLRPTRFLIKSRGMFKLDNFGFERASLSRNSGRLGRVHGSKNESPNFLQFLRPTDKSPALEEPRQVSQPIKARKITIPPPLPGMKFNFSGANTFISKGSRLPWARSFVCKNPGIDQNNVFPYS